MLLGVIRLQRRVKFVLDCFVSIVVGAVAFVLSSKSTLIRSHHEAFTSLSESGQTAFNIALTVTLGLLFATTHMQHPFIFNLIHNPFFVSQKQSPLSKVQWVLGKGYYWLTTIVPVAMMVFLSLLLPEVCGVCSLTDCVIER